MLARAQAPVKTVKVLNAQARETMADSGSEDIAVIGNTDLTPSESENNIKNTVKTVV